MWINVDTPNISTYLTATSHCTVSMDSVSNILCFSSFPELVLFESLPLLNTFGSNSTFLSLASVSVDWFIVLQLKHTDQIVYHMVMSSYLRNGSTTLSLSLLMSSSSSVGEGATVVGPVLWIMISSSSPKCPRISTLPFLFKGMNVYLR